MTLATLINAVAARMKDSRFALLTHEDYEDHVLAGILEYSRHRPYYRKGTLMLVSGVADYPAPADFIKALSVEWGDKLPNAAPWEERAVSALPSILSVDGQIHIDPVATAGMIGAWGTTFTFLYQARHSVTDPTSTIPDEDEILVRLAALRSACLEIAAASDQSEAFVKRYTSLAKRYGERFHDLIGAERPVTVRS